MTAVLTIKAEAAGALDVLERIRTLIDQGVNRSERLNGVAQRLKEHYKAASNELVTMNGHLQTAMTLTQHLAGASKITAGSFMTSLGVVSRLNSEMQSLRANAEGAARASARIGTGGGTGRSNGSVGINGGTSTGPGSTPFTFTPNTVAAPKAATAPTSRVTYDKGLNFNALGLGALTSGAGAALSFVADKAERIVGKGLELAWNGFKTGAITGAALAGTLVGNSVRLALKAEPIAGGFSSLTKSKGLGDEAAVLRELQGAAKGTVSDLQLMTNTNAALMLGAANTTDELKLLVEGGRRLGKAMGRDATEGFNDLAIGIGRQSRMILDNLGIIIHADQVYEDYAKANGTTADALTETEKKLVFQAAAFESVRKKMSELGAENITAADKIERVKASFSNLSVSFGQELLPVLGDVADRWAGFIDKLSADDVGTAMRTTIDGVKTAAGSVLDYLFPDSLLSDGAALGGDLWRAFTDPSKEAFQIVGKRFEMIWNDIKGEWKSFWETVSAGIQSIPAQVTYGIGVGLEAVGLEKWGKSAKDKAGAKIDALATEADGPKREAIEQNKKLEEQIRKLRETIETNAKNRPDSGALAGLGGRGGAGGVDGGPGGFGMTASSKATLLAERARAQAEEAAKASEKAAKAAAEKKLHDEINAREKLIDKLDQESRKRQDTLNDLIGARTNAQAALAGKDDPTITLSKQLDNAARELRDMPGIFDSIKTKIADNGDALAKTISDFNKTIDGVFASMDDNMKKRANSFLQEAPQDGETVRVRAIKRRAQRDLRRSNSSIVNDAFRSEGFNNEKSADRSNTLNQRFPQLETALAQIRQQDGSTQITQIQEQINAILIEHSAKLKENRDAQAKLLTEQAAANKKNEELQGETNKLVGEAIAEEGRHAAAITSLQKQVAGLTKELDRVARLARK